MARKFGWTVVRSIGQLQILTRVSVLALLAIPILASLTTVLQKQFENWPALGTSTALLFFAAVFITIGQVLYQTRAPDLIRKQDEDAFIEWVQKRYPEGPDRADGLRRATDALAAIARIRSDRNATLVRHHNELVWIPPKSNIERFKDLPAPATKLSEKDEPITVDPDRPGKPGTMPGAERERIAIEEGARAEYWVEGRKNLRSAFLSFACSFIALLALVTILFIQSYQVGSAAGWGWWGVIALVIIIIIIALAFIMVTVRSRSEEPKPAGGIRSSTLPGF